jgi:rhamnosyltransferase
VSKDPLISVVIPVKNGDAWLDKTLSGIYQQTLSHEIEVIIIDSGSTDNTANILSKFPVQVYSIDPKTFNHGTVRNTATRYAKGKYVAMTVQDAQPADDKWLQEMLDCFDDEEVAGVCGAQIVPHDADKNPIDWYRPMSAPIKRKYHFRDRTTFMELPAGEVKRICSWDNVNAMYRRDALLAVPFKPVSFAEDALWARDVLLAGYSIVYNPAAKVKHYHFEDPEYTFKRSFTVYYHFYKFFGVKPVVNGNNLIDVLKNAKLLLKEECISWKAKINWLVFNYRQRTAFNRAAMLFNDSLKKGENNLEQLHNELCRNAPQAHKPVAT